MKLTAEKRKFLEAYLGADRLRQLEEVEGEQGLAHRFDLLTKAKGRFARAFKQGPQSFEEHDAELALRSLADVYLSIISNILAEADLMPEERSAKIEAATAEFIDRLNNPPQREKAGRPPEAERKAARDPYARGYLDDLLHRRRGETQQTKALRGLDHPAAASVADLLAGQIEQSTGNLRGG